MGVDLNYFSENFQSADDEVSSEAHVDSSGDTEQTVQDAVEYFRQPERQVPINLSAVNLEGRSSSRGTEGSLEVAMTYPICLLPLEYR